MNLAALREEVKARGFDDADDTRVDTWVNVAYTEICELEAWPFLLATTSGVAPLTVADLRTIESVTDTSLKRKLTPADRRAVSDNFPDLSSAGSPVVYFKTAQTTVDVFPANTSHMLQVRYWKVPAELSADSDIPVLPARYHYAIVDYAVARARDDDSDDAGAAAARGSGDRLVGLMRDALLGGQEDRPLLLRVGGGDDW